MVFNEPVTEAVEYTFTVPSYAFEVGNYPANWYVEGFSFTLTVDPEAGVDSAVMSAETVAEYFGLNGLRLDHPAKGRPVIIRCDGKTYKQILKR